MTVPCIGHDPDAFEECYRRHIEVVSRFVARRVDDPHTAADLTAEVFLAVIDSVHTYRPERGSELGWLYGVARNVLAAERRRAARELQLSPRNRNQGVQHPPGPHTASTGTAQRTSSTWAAG